MREAREAAEREIEAARQSAQQEIEAAKQERETAKQEREAAKQEREAAKQEREAAQKIEEKANQEVKYSSHIARMALAHYTASEIKNSLMEEFGLSKEEAEEEYRRVAE